MCYRNDTKTIEYVISSPDYMYAGYRNDARSDKYVIFNLITLFPKMNFIKNILKKLI